MAACLVATYSGSDFLGQLLTIESSGFCAVPCKEDPQEVEFLDNFMKEKMVNESNMNF